MEEEEIWKDIPGYEGRYHVSNKGRVKSITYDFYTKTGKLTTKYGRIRLLHVNPCGYPELTLKMNGTRKTTPVHVLVAMAFLNHNPNGFLKVVNHIDGNRSNNNVCNLELVSHRDNLSTRFRGFKKPLHSSHVGVTWDKNNKRWRSMIQINKKNIYLGSFKIETDASNAYQKALSNHLQNTK